MAGTSQNSPGAPANRKRALTARERLVLTLLRRNGPMSRSELIRATELSGTAIFRATEDLAAAGLVGLGEPVRDGRGQPSNRVELQARSALALGLSVMTDSAEAVLMDLAGSVVARETLGVSALTRADVFAAARRFAGKAVRRLGASDESLTAVGLAVAGFFTGTPGHLNPAEALDDWALSDLVADAGDIFSAPVRVENIANAAAVGEALLGAGQDYASFAYVSVASGFGGGFVLGGEPWRGAHGNAGEFAALLKHAGCSVPNLESLREALARRGVRTESVGDLVARYDPDWPGLEDWVTENAAAFRLLAHLVHYCVDVEALVIGGRMPADLAVRIADAAAIDPAERASRVRRGVPHPGLAIVAATTGPSSAAIGAAAIPLFADFFTPLAQTRGSD